MTNARPTSQSYARDYLRDVVFTYEGDECLPWPYAKTKKGYASVGGGKRVSRLVCEFAHGPPPTPRHQAAHSCGHRACVAKAHLSWKTPSANQMDRVEHGTSNRGERHASAKLTESDVLKIRALRGVVSQAAVAQQFGVSSVTVDSIQNLRAWGWLETQP